MADGVSIDAPAAIAAATNLAAVADQLRDLMAAVRPTLEAPFLDTGEADANAIKSGWYDEMTRNVNDVLNIAGANVDVLGTGAHTAVRAFSGQDTDVASSLRGLIA